MRKLSLDTFQCVLCVSKIDTTINNLTMIFNQLFDMDNRKVSNPRIMDVGVPANIKSLTVDKI